MKKVLVCVGVVSAGLLVAACGPPPLTPVGPPRPVSLVSVGSDNAAGVLGYEQSSISADGRYVAFSSISPDVVPGDTNRDLDVFVRDLEEGVTTRVSVSSGGTQGEGHSEQAAISSDGRYVAFASAASNLVPDDTNGVLDVFVHDRLTGQTERVSVSQSGGEGAYASSAPAISGDGAVVAFQTTSPLDPVDNNGAWDIYARDRTAGATERISVGLGGARADGESSGPSITPDGRYVAFSSLASNLVPDDTNGVRDVFVRDRASSTTTRESVRSDGGEVTGASSEPSLSDDGSVVVFFSGASGLVPGDTNGFGDVFARDRTTGVVTRVSVSTAGAQSDNGSGASAVSADGRYVAFASSGSTLDVADTNQRGDVFVHDRTTGVTKRISLSVSGLQLNDNSGAPSMSADGSRVAFTSSATNVVLVDGNDGPDVFVTDWPR